MSARSRAVALDGRPRPYARIAFASGMRHEQEGDLEGAARWFRRAAEADLSDAALRLGAVLGRLADQRTTRTTGGGGTGGGGTGGGTDGRSPGGGRRGSPSRQDRLMAEATRWLSEAHGSKHPEAIELITDMLNRQQRLAAQRAVEPAAH